jgi:hypothetical protein
VRAPKRERELELVREAERWVRSVTRGGGLVLAVYGWRGERCAAARLAKSCHCMASATPCQAKEEKKNCPKVKAVLLGYEGTDGGQLDGVMVLRESLKN